MAISTPAVVAALVVSTSAGAWFGWKAWNKRMRKEMEDELDKLNNQPVPGIGQTRKFLLGSEKFGFYWGSTQTEVRFFIRRPDGTEVTITLPVAALRTASIATVLVSFFQIAEMPVPPQAKLDRLAGEVQTTIAVQPVAVQQTDAQNTDKTD